MKVYVAHSAFALPTVRCRRCKHNMLYEVQLWFDETDKLTVSNKLECVSKQTLGDITFIQLGLFDRRVWK